MEVKPDDAAVAIRGNSLATSAAILVSRLTGLIREQVLSHYFGAGWALDAFVSAYRVPNLVRDLVAEGAFSQAFVAVLAREDDAARARRFTDKTLSFAFVTGVFVTALGTVFAPHIAAVTAGGFSGEAYDLSVTLTRLLFPFLTFAATSSVLMGVLNVRGRFFLPQSATAVMNLVAIAVGWAAAMWIAPDYMRDGGFAPTPSAAGGAIRGMAWGILAGAAAACTALFVGAVRTGYRPRFDAGFKDIGLTRIGGLVVPAAVGAAAVQVNALVNTAFASYLTPGSVSYLNYAFRLVQFPLGLFGAGIAVAAMPSFARLGDGDATEGLTEGLRAALKLSLFFALPATLGLAALAEPIVVLIYEHGRFGPIDTAATAQALMAYAAGVCGYALAKIYQAAFLARQDAKTPMAVSLICIALNLTLNLVFARLLGYPHWALALSTALAAMTHFLLFAALFRVKIGGVWNEALWRHLGKVLTASILMVAAAWWVMTQLDASSMRQSCVIKFARALLPIGIGASVYFAAAALLGIEEARIVLAKMTRRRI